MSVFCGVNNSCKVDFIIVGQGLAGSVLAVQLHNAGKEVSIIDQQENHSSRIAAGLFNPVTGKNLSKTWLANEVFAKLHSFYRQAEQLLNASFFHPFPIYRPFLTIEEQNEWMGMSASIEWVPFIEKVLRNSAMYDGVQDSLGGLLLKQTGFVNTNRFLDAVKDFFIKKNAYLSEAFDHSNLRLSSTKITYKNIEAQSIIFCEGTGVSENPLFNWLPIRALKGETLSVNVNLPKDVLVNRGVYAVPIAENSFKIGATYETKENTPAITEKGRQELTSKFEEIFSLPYTVVGQEWGFRPTTPDRRPILGEHPLHKNVLVFNGLGTKGVSLAPYSSQLLSEYLCNRVHTDAYATVDVNRYYSLYWKSVKKP